MKEERKHAMKGTPDLDLYPPFTGFPDEGIRFLRTLKRNNNRPWFEKNRETYETQVKLPMQSLIVDLQPHMKSLAPEFEADPKRSLFRIYRDVRFSKDKRPYKTHVAAQFVFRGGPKGKSGAGFYLHVEPGEVYIGAGSYMPESDQLKKIRKAIAEKPQEFKRVVNNASFKRRFKRIEGEKLTRVPAGFEPDHPMAEWLRQKQFFVWLEFPESVAKTGRFVGKVAEIFEDAYPLVKFLNDAIGTAR